METPIPQILETRPFGLEIERAEDLRGDQSGRADFVLRIRASGRDYKLRVCDTEATATAIAEVISHAPTPFPPFLGRDGRCLLFEWLSGSRKPSVREYRDRADFIGRTCAIVHTVPCSQEHDHVRHVRRLMKRLTRDAQPSRSLVARVGERCERALGSMRFEKAFDLWDTHRGNLLTDGKTMHFVDEEGMRPQTKGLGFARFLRRVRDHDQWSRFLAGYAEIGDLRYLTDDYLLHLQMVDAIRGVLSKRKLGKSADKEYHMLERLATNGVTGAPLLWPRRRDSDSSRSPRPGNAVEPR